MGEYLKSPAELHDLMKILREERGKPGTREIAITGSTTSKGSGHNDIDLLVVREEASPDLSWEIAIGPGGTIIDVFTTNPKAIQQPHGEDGKMIRSLHKKRRVVFRR